MKPGLRTDTYKSPTIEALRQQIAGGETNTGSFWTRIGRTGTPLDPGWVAKEFIKGPKLPLTFYIDAGLFEVDVEGTGGSNLETGRHMRDVLRAKGYEVHWQEFAGGHEYLSWRGTLADGLIALLGKTDGAK